MPSQADADADDELLAQSKLDSLPTWPERALGVGPGLAEEVPPRRWLPHVVLICCQCAFAVMHISSHPALEHIPPLPYSAVRVTLALPLLFAGARIKVRPQDLPRNAVKQCMMRAVDLREVD